MTSASRPDTWIVRLSSLGDIVQALPVVAPLRAAGCEVGWVVERRFASLFDYVDVGGPVPHVAWDRDLRSRKQLRTAGSDASWSIDLQGNWKSALVSRALGARTRVAPARRDLRERTSVLVPALRAPLARGPHVLDRAASVLEPVLKREVTSAELPGPPFLRVSATRAGGSSGTCADISRDTLVVVLQHPSDPRSIPTSIIEGLARHRPVLGLAGPRESGCPWPTGWNIVKQESGGIDDLIRFGCTVAGRGVQVLGPDCGATHVLRACGAETWFAFGPQDPSRTGPLDARVVTRTRTPALECQPCVAKVCRLSEGPRCMRELDVDRILEALASAG